ncbi:MAG: hypothetical protein WEB00_03095 [Dehalococcoidia bacterium]
MLELIKQLLTDEKGRSRVFGGGLSTVLVIVLIVILVLIIL